MLKSWDRVDLVALGEHLKISGYNNSFENPFVKKEQLIQRIQSKRKKFASKKKKRVNSTQKSPSRTKGGGDSAKAAKERKLKTLKTPQDKYTDFHFVIQPQQQTKSRVVVIGDLHGDMKVTLKALRPSKGNRKRGPTVSRT